MRPSTRFALLLVSVVFACCELTPVVASATPDSAEQLRPDRSLSLADLGELDGRSQPPVVSKSRWWQAYFELRGAVTARRSMPECEVLRSRIAGLPEVQRGRAIPIGVLDFTAQGLHDAAVHLESSGVFTASVLRSESYQGRDVRFTLPSELYFTDRSRMPTQVFLDADDGLGPRQLTPGGFVDVHYQVEGSKRLQLLASNGADLVRTAQFVFDVLALAAPAPSDTLQLTASIPFQGSAATGDAYLYYADGHSSLVAPVVLVEGFDLDNSLNWDEIYALLNAQNLLEDLRAAGFDLVVLNFDDATTEIQRNSMLVVELLQQVQQRIDPQAHFTLAGASMGGVCSRYALAYMEQNGQPHRVNTWISFDAPHGGANIPLGLQHWLDFFKDESAEAAFLLSRLDRPAARQLLVYHHLAPAGQADPLRASLLQDLASLGDYPSGVRRVAIANGSGSGQGQGFAPGDQIMRWEFDNFVNQITGNVWAVGSGPTVRVFDGVISLFYIPIDQLEVSVGGTLPFDNAPGGSRASMAQAGATPAPYGDIIALHPSHCFVPTISALALDTTDLFYDIAGDPNLLAHSPFDALYYPPANEEHVLVTPQNAQWIKDEISTSPTGVLPGTGPSMLAILHPNVPNPFNPSTSISYTLWKDGPVELKIYDATGRLVRSLFEGHQSSGTHSVTWAGHDDRGRSVGSGVYLYRLRAAPFEQTRRLLLLK